MFSPRRVMPGLPLVPFFALCLAFSVRAEDPAEDTYGAPQLELDCSVAFASEACPRTRIALAARAGVAEVDFPTTASQVVRGHGTTLHLSAAVSPLRRYTFALELPLALLRLTHEADDARQFTWGNPTLSVRRAEPLWTSRTRDFLAIIGLALAVPAAQNSEAHGLRAGRAQALARALDGNRRPFLFLPGYLTISPSLGLENRIRRFGVTMQLDLPLAIRVADTGLGDTATRHVAWTPVLNATGRLQATHWLELSLWTAGVFGAPPPLSVDQPARAFQLTVEPAISVRSRHHLLTASLTVPLGGPLGQDVIAGMLQSTVRW